MEIAGAGAITRKLGVNFGGRLEAAQVRVAKRRVTFFGGAKLGPDELQRR